MVTENTKKKIIMISNILWIILGGAICALELLIVGALIFPFNHKLSHRVFKTCKELLFPFKKEVKYHYRQHPVANGCFTIFGFIFFLQSCLIGGLFCLTIIGLPFAHQWFKMASLFLAPFGITFEDIKNNSKELTEYKSNAKQELEYYVDTGIDKTKQLKILNEYKIQAKEQLDNY